MEEFRVQLNKDANEEKEKKIIKVDRLQCELTKAPVSQHQIWDGRSKFAVKILLYDG